MPPKKTTPAKTTGAKGAAAKPKAGAAKTGGAGAAKTGGAGAAKKTAAAPAKPAEPLPSYHEIDFKQVNNVVVNDKEGKIKASGKWALIVDPADRVSTLLRYGNVNYLNVLQPRDMEPDIIRMALLGALRYGKPLVIDFMEGDMYGSVVELFDRVRKDLLSQILDKSIMQEETYSGLVKETDGTEYSKEKFYSETDNFSFIILGNKPPNDELLRRVYPVKITE